MNTIIRQFAVCERIILKSRCEEMTAFFAKYKRLDGHPEFYDYEAMKKHWFTGKTIFTRKFSAKTFWDKLDKKGLTQFFGYTNWLDDDEVKTSHAYDKLIDLVDLLECSCTVSLDSQTAKMIDKIL